MSESTSTKRLYDFRVVVTAPAREEHVQHPFDLFMNAAKGFVYEDGADPYDVIHIEFRGSMLASDGETGDRWMPPLEEDGANLGPHARQPKAGTWSVKSKLDPRWNGHGAGYGFLTMGGPPGLGEHLRACAEMYGDPPMDVEWDFTKD